MLKIKNSGTIKIITSFSGFGGSTILFIELCRLFNEHGISAEFYGPDSWHLNKYKNCKNIKNLKINPNDYIIGHMIDNGKQKGILHERTNCKNCVLSIHEKSAHLLVPADLSFYNSIVFASESHMEWHSYYKGLQNKVVIPTPQTNLSGITYIKPEAQGVAGVIGFICCRKQTHISILRALRDGCRKVLLFGLKNGPKNDLYFNSCVFPLLGKNVIYCGEMHMDQKQKMYEMISCVYHSSVEEIACLVQGECEIVGLPFHGNCNTIPYEMWPAAKIVKAWVNVLNYR